MIPQQLLLDRGNSIWYFKEKEGDFVRDFKAFTTENGVATLVLRQIPYRKTAYITIQSAADPDALITDCIEFCTAVGADRVYATGHSVLAKYPHAVDIISMKRNLCSQAAPEVKLVPATEDSLECWRELYNTKMEKVTFGAFLDRAQAKTLLQDESLYFAYKEDALVGIGSIFKNVIRTVASLQPGAGEQILEALCVTVDSELVELEVAADNQKAVSLYKRMGFTQEGKAQTWYMVYKKDQA